MESEHNRDLRLALPKGRMYDAVVGLLAGAGIKIRVSERDYRPQVSLAGINAKILKPRNVIGMLQAGARDLGFAGADWVIESGAELTELLDTELNPVRLVVAAPIDILVDGRLPARPLVVASEYPCLAKQWIERSGIDATVLTTFGATEVFPPEDADCIIDNTATGSTLRANGLKIVDEIMQSSTRLYASNHALEVPHLKQRIDNFVMLVNSVLDARRRVMLDLNVEASKLSAVTALLPSMREPTISQLSNDGWYAVRSAVPRNILAKIIPLLKEAGACDIITSSPEQIII
ncbi:MAG TPA: ATP phosphoribosyltransferase [Pirellulaceae bacterium]|nr:ATP phosphoribosyltransferase [Pirellulaceae bacterium]HMO92379.1 ATP phosphoribosyltransferase [Pirellulaceae bacterium]HMP70758.1 ATP phosphoribosyltransferase [Pirellulaceae bacterium]